MDWERLTQDQIEESLDQFAGLSSAATARVCDLIAEVDTRQSWMDDGARTLTDWVAAKLRVRRQTAARLVSVSRRLIDLPLLTEALSQGELSFDQVDAVASMATADTEQALIDQAHGMTSAAIDRIARRERGRTEAEELSVWERRRLVRQWNLDESELRFHGRLPGAEGRVFDQAIDQRVDQIGVNPETGMFDPLQTRSADALAAMAADAAGTGPGSTSPTRLTVFVDVETLTADIGGISELDNTALVSNQVVQRLACDAIIETVLREGGSVVGVGRQTRKIPRWLRRQVHHRDGGRCQFPECGNTLWLQVHHIVPWALGGPTDLDNLILLCGFHHRFVHEHGWRITGSPDRRVFRRPDWTPYPQPRADLDPRLRELVRST